MPGTESWTVGFVKHAGAWGDAAQAVGALNKVKILSESLPPMHPAAIRDESVGDVLAGSIQQGRISGNGAVTEVVRYEGFERRLALLAGADTVNVLEAALSFEHVMVVQNNIAGKFGTWVLDKGIGSLGSDVHEYPTCKPNTIELSHTDDKLQAAINYIPNRCERSSPVNGATEMGNLTLPSAGLTALFTQMSLQIAEITGTEDNLDSGDAQCVTAVRFNFDRKQEGEVTNCSGGEVDEPETNGFPEANLVLTFGNYRAAQDALLVKPSQIIQPGNNPKVYKASLVWTGPEIPGTAGPDYYLFAIDLPNLVVTNAPTNAGGAGQKVPVEITLGVQTPSVAPDGTDWAWVSLGSNPFRFRIQNGNSASMS